MSNTTSSLFGGQLHDFIGGAPGLEWWTNFNRCDLASHASHWSDPGDPDYVGSADLVSWGGHSSDYWFIHIFKSGLSCDPVDRNQIKPGVRDTEWVIFDTCWLLTGTDEELKGELLPSDPTARCPHMFLGSGQGSGIMTQWGYGDCGWYFAKQLRDMPVLEAWFEYCEEKQPKYYEARVFRVPSYDDESLAGPGPIKIKRDPSCLDGWEAEVRVNQRDP